jgi:superoxide dismutase, Cu-Zn family
MRRIRITFAALAVLALGGATVAFAGDRGEAGGNQGTPGKVARATLVDASGAKVGHVWMQEQRRLGIIQLVARLRDLPPGFHGFHIHTTGRCDAPGFTTAGGHLQPNAAAHGGHAGDLPSLLATDDGTALLATMTDRFSLGDLRDADGSAVMVHSGPDNFANIPPRYGTPDQETLDTGDSGYRLACGVVR